MQEIKLNEQINLLNVSNTEYANYIQSCKKKKNDNLYT